jgi:hypothetical protein
MSEKFVGVTVNRGFDEVVKLIVKGDVPVFVTCTLSIRCMPVVQVSKLMVFGAQAKIGATEPPVPVPVTNTVSCVLELLLNMKYPFFRLSDNGENVMMNTFEEAAGIVPLMGEIEKSLFEDCM